MRIIMLAVLFVFAVLVSGVVNATCTGIKYDCMYDCRWSEPVPFMICDYFTTSCTTASGASACAAECPSGETCSQAATEFGELWPTETCYLGTDAVCSSTNVCSGNGFYSDKCCNGAGSCNVPCGTYTSCGGDEECIGGACVFACESAGEYCSSDGNCCSGICNEENSVCCADGSECSADTTCVTTDTSRCYNGEYQTRDSQGDCTSACSCSYDPWTRVGTDSDEDDYDAQCEPQPPDAAGNCDVEYAIQTKDQLGFEGLIELTCDDGTDNDCDGYVDIDDLDCRAYYPCEDCVDLSLGCTAGACHDFGDVCYFELGIIFDSCIDASELEEAISCSDLNDDPDRCDDQSFWTYVSDSPCIWNGVECEAACGNGQADEGLENCVNPNLCPQDAGCGGDLGPFCWYDGECYDTLDLTMMDFCNDDNDECGPSELCPCEDCIGEGVQAGCALGYECRDDGGGARCLPSGLDPTTAEDCENFSPEHPDLDGGCPSGQTCLLPAVYVDNCCIDCVGDLHFNAETGETIVFDPGECVDIDMDGIGEWQGGTKEVIGAPELTESYKVGDECTVMPEERVPFWSPAITFMLLILFYIFRKKK